MVLRKQLKSFDLDTNLMMHKHWTCGLFSQGTRHYSTCKAFLQRQGTVFEYSLALGPIEPGTNLFVVPRGTMMLIETRHMLSLVPYVADTTFCTICVIIQDGIDLIA